MGRVKILPPWVLCTVLLAMSTVPGLGLSPPSSPPRTSHSPLPLTSHSPLPPTSHSPLPPTSHSPLPPTSHYPPLPYTFHSPPQPNKLLPPNDNFTLTKRPTIPSTISSSLNQTTQVQAASPITHVEGNCSAFSEFCESIGSHYVHISASNPCAFTCQYGPTKVQAVRLEVHLKYKSPLEHRTFVVAQQKYAVTSWTLPIIFPHHGLQNYTSIEQMLCPATIPGNETVSIRVATESSANVTVQLRVTAQQYDLEKGVNVTLKTSPVSWWVKVYRWEAGEDAVMVTADSHGTSQDVCAVLVLKNAKCDYMGEGGAERRQSFTLRAAMVARRTDFPDGVHIEVGPLPDDAACTLGPASPGNNTSRHKTVVLGVWQHDTIAATWYVFLATAGVLAALVAAFTTFALTMIKRNLSIEGGECSDDDEDLLVGGSTTVQVSVGVGVMAGTQAVCGQGPSAPEGDLEEMEALNHSPFYPDIQTPPDHTPMAPSDPTSMAPSDPPPSYGVKGMLALPYAPHTTYSPSQAALAFTPTFNPRIVWWWRSLAVAETRTAEALVAESGFQNNLIIMAVFAALPSTELVKSYLQVLTSDGQDDQCYFNSRCLTGLWFMPDFARVFTNLGYVMAGVGFMAVVARHRTLTHATWRRNGPCVGVTRHYGLLVSVGVGLVLQGVMSALYHTCPNNVTIRFDMMFMYVLAVSGVVLLWGFRHGDVTHHVYPTMLIVALMLLMAQAREWVGHVAFWTAMALLHALLALPNAVMLARFGVWSFSPYQLLRIWRGWRPVAARLGSEMAGASTIHPAQVLRVTLGLLGNAGLVMYGVVTDPNPYTYVLAVCLGNMAMYFTHYLGSKLCRGERVLAVSAVSLGVSGVLWVLALAAFVMHSTDSEASPAASRQQNSPCVYLGVFDNHDAWHLLSAFALYTFFVGVLTLDDDLHLESSKRISVF